MRASYRGHLAFLLASMAVAALAMAGTASMAAAAPKFGLQLERDQPVVTRSDERVDYTIKVENIASTAPSPGDQLTCDGAPAPLGSKEWFRQETTDYSFEFRWLRDGVPIAGWVGGAPGSTYTVEAEDSGSVIQCLVKGTNGTGSGSFVAASQPMLTVEPAPAVQPPEPNITTAGARRPAVAGPLVAGTETTTGAEWKAGEELRCTAPVAGWSESAARSPIAWTFEWLRDGQPAAGTVSSPSSTTSRYVLTSEDVSAPAAPAVFQCIATATNAGGSVVVESAERNTKAPPVGTPAFAERTEDGAPFQGPGQVPVIEFANATTGVVTVELELPGGLETYVYQPETGGSGWSCSARAATAQDPATATCSRSDTLSPGQAYGEGPGEKLLEVAVALGADAPGVALAKATVSGGGATSSTTATDSFVFGPALPFGISAFSTEVTDATGVDYTQAGGHPFSAQANISFNRRRNLVQLEPFVYRNQRPVEHVKDVKTDIPPGFIGNPQAVRDLCPNTESLLKIPSGCPAGSAVGELAFQAPGFGKQNPNEKGYLFKSLPLYAMQPEDGVPAQFAVAEPQTGGVYVLTPRLRPDGNYAISIDSVGLPESVEFMDFRVILCGYGAKTSLAGGNSNGFDGCKTEGEAGALAAPLLTNPTECSSTPPVTTLHVDSWEHPGVYKTAEAIAPRVTGCASVPFRPSVDLQPTSHQADSPTGLDVAIALPSEGLETPGAISQGDLKDTVVSLPNGMSVNPAAADGLGACSQRQLGMVEGVPNDEPVRCPDASKIGTAELQTPLLERPLSGSVYLARQGENPFHSLLALYLVVESKERGILVKIPGKVEADPGSGRLVATFDDNPQVPFSSLKLHFNAGNRAPLLTPPTCGGYNIESQLSPWSAPDSPVTKTSTFQVTEGPNGGACPDGGLAPKLEAGLQNPVAGTTSPFTLRLSREDGTQRFRALDVAMPPGLTAYLKGVPYCPDSALASVSEAEGTGQAQIEHPSCPAASQIGTVSVGAGGGSNPFYVNTGRAYLAGPYKGAPLSIAIVTPAVAGPFDLGSVVVRSAVHVDPETARITVDSDPIPTILHGIPLDVRDIRVNVDRPQFTLAPTSCEAKAVGATVTGEGGATASPSNRFQVGDCASLGFAPKLKLRLDGATKRIGHPALKAVVTYPKGGSYANIARAQVNLPHGEFLDQGNLNKTCTRPVLLAGNCPKSSVYGKAKAWTPLLDKPLEGNVYLVGGYGYKLPALVAELDGQIRVTLVGKVDSGKNKGIRNTFEVVPDAPVSRFVLEMKGGKKYGLLENSENLCKASKAKRRAIVRFTGQNGKVDAYKPVVQNECGKHRKKKAKKRARHARANLRLAGSDRHGPGT